MGLDIVYQAIPDDEEIINLARTFQIEYWLMHPYPINIIPQQYSLHELMLFERLTKLYEKHHGIEERKFVTRRWDILLFLVSDKRRKVEIDDYPEDFWRRIIIGGTPIAENERFRLLRTDEVQEAAILLEQSFLDKYWFQIFIMESLNVYKSWQHEQNEATFKLFESDFEKLKRVYYQAAEHGEAIISHMF